MIIFVSGPYSHPDDMRVLNNVENAMWVGYELTRRGHWPVVPHLMHYFDMFLRRERIAHPHGACHRRVAIDDVGRNDFCRVDFCREITFLAT